MDELETASGNSEPEELTCKPDVGCNKWEPPARASRARLQQLAGCGCDVSVVGLISAVYDES